MASAGYAGRPAESPVTTSREPGWWGMVLLIATEATLFIYLIASYFYLRFYAATWPPKGIERPEILIPAINTVILLSSSIPMHLADMGIRSGNVRRLRIGLAGSFILGAIFLSLQLFEYSRLTFQPQTNVFGSLFYTITGFHGAHVMVGLILIAVTEVKALRGYFSAEHHLAVQTTAMYWHFVDAVWIVVFTSLYLL